MGKIFIVENGKLTFEELVEEVEQTLKLGSVGMVVNSFRQNGKMSLLEDIIPHLTRGNRDAINAVLYEDILGAYF